MQLYAAIARGGDAVALHAVQGRPGGAGARVLGPGAAWQVADILAGAPAPAVAPAGQIAFKTGTSYGHRDAWAIGFDGRYVVGVWVGRPDAAAVPGITGIGQAAPLLFEAFARFEPAAVPLRAAASRRADGRPGGPAAAAAPRPGAGPAQARGDDSGPLGPEIFYPPDGARVELARGMPLAIKIRNGAPPFTWLVNGAPVETDGIDREIATRAAAGFVSLTVIDAEGRAASAKIVVE